MPFLFFLCGNAADAALEKEEEEVEVVVEEKVEEGEEERSKDLKRHGDGDLIRVHRVQGSGAGGFG